MEKITMRVDPDAGKRGGRRLNSGRKTKDFDKNIFENLCKIQCTVNEIEEVLGSNQTVIDKWCMREYSKSFAKVRDDLRSSGKASLRRMQFKLAEKNAGMAIFLGKNILGQTDQIVQEIKQEQTVITKTILELPDNGRTYRADN